MSVKTTTAFDIDTIESLADELAEQSNYTASASAEYKDGKLTILLVQDDEAVAYQAEFNTDLVASMDIFHAMFETAAPAEDLYNQWNAVIAAMEDHRLTSVEIYSK